MRKIKFRAWEYNKHTKNYEINYNPTVWDDETGEDYSEVDLNLALANGGDADKTMGAKSIFLEYTGLKDKNGKKIYEDDIIKNDGKNGIVTYDEEYGCWTIIEDVNIKSLCLVAKNGEVIGNIYENPELLEK